MTKGVDVRNVAEKTSQMDFSHAELLLNAKKESDNGKTLTVEADMDLKRKMSDSPELTPEKAAKIIDACALPDFRSNVPRKSLKPNDISTPKGNINDGRSRS